MLVLHLTNNNYTDVGWSAALQFLPMLIAGSWAGLIIDRSRKRPVLYLTQVAFAVLAASLAALVATGHDPLWAVFTISALVGMVNLFDNPARQTFVGEMVGQELLPNAVSLNTVIMNAARVIGPAAGGILVASVGFAACFAVNAASYLAVLVALVAMRGAELQPTKPVRAAKGQVREGLRYVWGEPRLRGPLLTMTVVGILAFNFTITLLALAKGTFHSSNQVASYFMIAMGLGAVVGGLAAARSAQPSERRLALLGLGFGATMLLVAVAPTVPLALVALVPMGALSIAFVATANGTLQLNSAPQLRGRVMALYAIAFLGTTPIGAPLIGEIARVTSPRWAIVVGGVATFVSSTLLLRQGDAATIPSAA